jgi:hypothetical protein
LISPIGQAEAYAIFMDTLQIVSALPNSTPVTIRFEMELHDALSGDLSGTHNAQSLAQLTGLGAMSIMSIDDRLIAPAGTHFVAYDYATTVGSFVEVGLQLRTTAYGQNGSAVADAFHTGNFAVTLPQGFSYVSTSGTQYAESLTATPEPGTWSMLIASGLALAVGCMRSPSSLRTGR